MRDPPYKVTIETYMMCQKIMKHEPKRDMRLVVLLQQAQKHCYVMQNVSVWISVSQKNSKTIWRYFLFCENFAKFSVFMQVFA